jgi:hypothetical protein
MFIAWGPTKMILHPQRGDMFGRLICDKTFELVDLGSEKLFTRTTAMNMSPRWGEESWRGTVSYKHLTPPG